MIREPPLFPMYDNDRVDQSQYDRTSDQLKGNISGLIMAKELNIIPFFFIRSRYLTPLSQKGRGVGGEGN
jgi:hypothetical protein